MALDLVHGAVVPSSRKVAPWFIETTECAEDKWAERPRGRRETENLPCEVHDLREERDEVSGDTYCSGSVNSDEIENPLC